MSADPVPVHYELHRYAELTAGVPGGTVRLSRSASRPDECLWSYTDPRGTIRQAIYIGVDAARTIRDGLDAFLADLEADPARASP